MEASFRSRITGRARAALRALRSGDADTAARGERVEADYARVQQQLQERVDALESLVEGLQDAVHRESVRHDEQIDALEKKTEPEEIARALSDDARRRGL